MSFPDAIKTKIEFGDFKLTNKILGIGAFGAVQLAKHQKTNNYYALKIIDLSKFQGSVEQDFAKKEIMIHSKTNHKHIIKFYGTIKKNETLYHVLEYAENGNLYKMIKRNQKLTETQIFRFFFQTVLAVKYLHENDIIHRDIKPENLLLDKRNCIKLCDFGWSDISIKELKKQFCGTYEYMAPEIIERKLYNYKVDIWSLGILLYELYYGYTPFRTKNEGDKREIVENIKKAEMKFEEPISKDLKNLIQSLLNKDPNNRLEINQIIRHKWVQKKLYAKPIQVNECINSIVFNQKKIDPSTPLKKTIPLVMYDSATPLSRKKNIFGKSPFQIFPISVSEINSIMNYTPSSATKNKSFVLSNSSERGNFTEECSKYMNEKKEKYFKNSTLMLESMKELNLIEKNSNLSIISEYSTIGVSDEGTPNKINLFLKNNTNKDLEFKITY